MRYKNTLLRGFLQKQIYAKIQEHKRMKVSQLYAEFAPFQANRNHLYRVTRVLDKLVEKGLIRYVTKYEVTVVDKD